MYNCYWSTKSHDLNPQISLFDCWLKIIDYLAPEIKFLGTEYEKIIKDSKWNLLNIHSDEIQWFTELGLKEISS